jgi:hypothetical protein
MNNTVLNNHLVIEEIRGEIKKIPTIKWKRNHNMPESVGYSYTVYG